MRIEEKFEYVGERDRTEDDVEIGIEDDVGERERERVEDDVGAYAKVIYV